MTRHFNVIITLIALTVVSTGCLAQTGIRYSDLELNEIKGNVKKSTLKEYVSNAAYKDLLIDEVSTEYNDRGFETFSKEKTHNGAVTVTSQQYAAGERRTNTEVRIGEGIRYTDSTVTTYNNSGLPQKVSYILSKSSMNYSYVKDTVIITFMDSLSNVTGVEKNVMNSDNKITASYTYTQDFSLAGYSTMEYLDGLLVKTVNYTLDNKTESILEYKYEDGRRVSGTYSTPVKDRGNYTETYSGYDAKGNWTRCEKTFAEDRQTFVTVREFEYR